MNLRELFEARSLPNENSYGRPIAQTTEALKNFWAWFKGSKVIDEHKRPLVMYHGTNADFAKFSYDYASVGAAEYGTGFYFSNSPSTASGYADPGVGTPNVIPVYLSIKKPMKSDSKRLLTGMQVSKFVTTSPNIDEYLSDNYDVPYSMKKAAALREVIELYASSSDSLLRQLNNISRDLYKNQDGAFLQNSIQITGYDGLVHLHTTGEYFYVAWDSDQIKSAVGNTGGYGAGGMVDENY
jgi:hypothetical protein